MAREKMAADHLKAVILRVTIDGKEVVTEAMEAVIVKRDERLIYSLDDRSGLVSHFRRFPLFDSKLESDFAADFEKAFQQDSHNWSLSRADAVIPVGRNEVMIPDFTLRDQKGREVHLEIVGFWTPEY